MTYNGWSQNSLLVRGVEAVRHWDISLWFCWSSVQRPLVFSAC